ncbi:copper resistance CopC/CopD family protein [Pseudogemmobacter faecipullorum]|uniref:Copper resistance protein CopC/CopD n=1 Tax=Pseudogemmobacter faecipullorum TaxID=2755041 RepID=A0ABS8CSY8_9RHOB|nr:copper resistance protein CopC [Pseudogemmobacter faecipullorum]MCB5412303.1 copper resistance protein CopC/CopD [Pseudogemmobacter faecipullorum]
MTRPVHRLAPRPVLWAAALIALAALLLPGASHAHAVLLGVTPAESALLETAPDVIVLAFNEPVAALAIALIGPDGGSTDLTQAASGDSRLTIALPDLTRGTQVLSWRVASADGHPVAGTLVFSVGEVTGAAEVASGDPIVAGLLWGAKLLMSVGLIFGIGGGLFGAIAGLPPTARRMSATLIWSGLAATPLALGLHGADALGLPLSALFNAAPWAAGWRTSFGIMTVLALMAGLFGLAGLSIRPLAVFATALLAAAYASAGHAGAADPQWLTRPAVFLHLAALCFWLGALIPLALWLRRDDGTAALKRFSDAIPFAVLLLAGSGIALGMVQMGGPEGLATAYGRILAVKLGLLALLFVLAAWNRWSLTGPALKGVPQATRRLRVVILIEMALVVAILGLAAGWRFTPPPRALALVVAAPAHTHIHTAAVMADVTVTPGTAGPVAMEIWLSDGDMQPITPQAVTVGLTLPERGIERMTYEATADADGLWHVPELILPLAGDWAIDLEIRLTRFSMTRIDGILTLK